MITDPGEIRQLAEAHHAEDLAFQRHVKAHHCSEELFHIIAAEVEAQIDCTACANCCRETTVAVSDAEIGAIAEYLGISATDAKQMYTVRDPDRSNSRVLRNDAECVFLHQGLCLIYEARPRPCRDFPHSHIRERTLGGRMESQTRRACLCPIVYNALEQYKHAVGFRVRDIPQR